MFGCVCKAHSKVMWEAARPISLTTAIRYQVIVNEINHNWLADGHLVMQLCKLIILGKKDGSDFVSAAVYEWKVMAQKWLSDTLEKISLARS